MVGEQNQLKKVNNLNTDVDATISYTTTRKRRFYSESDGESYLALPQTDPRDNCYLGVGRLQRSKSVMERRRKQSSQEQEEMLVRGESLEEWKGSERMLNRRNASTSEEVKESITNLKRKLRTESMYDWLLD